MSTPTMQRASETLGYDGGFATVAVEVAASSYVDEAFHVDAFSEDAAACGHGDGQDIIDRIVEDAATAAQ